MAIISFGEMDYWRSNHGGTQPWYRDMSTDLDHEIQFKGFPKL